MYTKREYIKENLNIINDLISKNTPKFEISRILGVKYQTLNKYLKEFGIEYEGNPSRKGIIRITDRTPIIEYLNKNGRFITASKLRKRLIDEGFKKEKCEKCNNTEWMGVKIPLELHHINGNHYDNRLENLQILCSNCHAIEHDYSNNSKKESLIDGELLNKSFQNKNNICEKEKNRVLEIKEKRYCVNCGKKLNSKQKKYCSKECYNENNRNRPSREELKEKLIELKHNLCAIGRFYKVSDTAIRKWIRLYKL